MPPLLLADRGCDVAKDRYGARILVDVDGVNVNPPLELSELVVAVGSVGSVFLLLVVVVVVVVVVELGDGGDSRCAKVIHCTHRCRMGLDANGGVIRMGGT